MLFKLCCLVPVHLTDVQVTLWAEQRLLRLLSLPLVCAASNRGKAQRC